MCRPLSSSALSIAQYERKGHDATFQKHDRKLQTARTMSEPTVAAGYARGLMELAVSKGASRRVLAQRSGIDPQELQDQDHRIPFAKYVALMEAGKELCHDPALALHFGE